MRHGILELVYYEFCKYINKFNITILVILLLVNIGTSFFKYGEYFSSDYKEYSDLKEEFIELYISNPDEYHRLLAAHTERLDEYNNEYYENMSDVNDKSIVIFENYHIDSEKYGDIELFSDVENAIYQHLEQYQKITSVLKDSVLRLEESDEQTYMSDYYTKLCEYYLNIVNAETSSDIFLTFGWNEFFSYDMSSILLWLALVTTLCGIFSCDIKAGMNNILHVSKYGEKRVVCAKLLFTTIVTVILTLVFILLPLIVLASSCGLSSIYRSISTLNEFQYCPYPISVGQYLLIYLFIKLIVFTLITLLTVMVDRVFGNDKFAFATSFVLVLTSVFISKIPISSPYYYLQKYSISEIVGVNILFDRFRGVNIFGHCLNYTYFVFALLIVTGVLFVLITTTNNTMYSQEYSSENSRFGKQVLSSGLLHGEIFKQLVCNKYYIVITSILIIKAISSGILYMPDTNHSEQLYKAYISELQGEVTENKLQSIHEEADYIATSISDYERATNLYRNGQINYEEYQNYKSRYNYAEYCKLACDRLCERRDYLLKIQKYVPNVEFVYDVGLEKYFSYSPDIISAILIILLGSGMFSIEYESRFTTIMRTVKNGRKKLFFVKLWYAFVISNVLYILSTAISLGFIYINYEIDYLHLPIQSMPMFESIAFDLTICEFFILYHIIMYFGYISFYLLVTALSVIFETQIKTIVISVSVVTIPYIFTSFSKIYTYLPSYIEMFTPINFYESFPSHILCITLTFLTILFAMKKWCGKELK